VSHGQLFIKIRIWCGVYICCSYSKNCKSSHLGKICLVPTLRVLPQHFVPSPQKLKVCIKGCNPQFSPLLRGLAFVHCMATLRITYIEDAFWNQANLYRISASGAYLPYRRTASLLFFFTLNSSRSAVASRLVTSVACSGKVAIPKLTRSWTSIPWSSR